MCYSSKLLPFNGSVKYWSWCSLLRDRVNVLSSISEADHPVHSAEVCSISHMSQAVVIRLVTSLVSELIGFEVLVVNFHFRFRFFKLVFRSKISFLGVEESLFSSETRVVLIIT